MMIFLDLLIVRRATRKGLRGVEPTEVRRILLFGMVELISAGQAAMRLSEIATSVGCNGFV